MTTSYALPAIAALLVSCAPFAATAQSPSYRTVQSTSGPICASRQERSIQGWRADAE